MAPVGHFALQRPSPLQRTGFTLTLLPCLVSYSCMARAIQLYETRQGNKVSVNPVLCKGDGLCNDKCPTGAIYLQHYTDEEVLAQIDAAVPALEEVEKVGCSPECRRLLHAGGGGLR